MSKHAHTIILFIMLFSFSSTYAMPIFHSYQVSKVVFDPIKDYKFMKSMKKVIDRLRKANKTGDAINCIAETETLFKKYYGIKVDISRSVDDLEKFLKKDIFRNLPNLCGKYCKTYKNKFKSRRKAIEDKVFIEEEMLSFLEHDTSNAEEYLEHLLNIVMGDEYPDTTPEQDRLPVMFEVSLSLMIAGGFLQCLPNPVAKEYGKRVFDMGMGLMVGFVIEECNKQDKNLVNILELPKETIPFLQLEKSLKYVNFEDDLTYAYN